MRKILSYIILPAFIFVANPSLVNAQVNPVQLSVDVFNAQQQNIGQLMSYSWKRDVKAKLNGEVKSTSLYQVRFNAEKKLEATKIGGDAPAPKKRGIRGKVIENKKGEIKEKVSAAVKLALSYTMMSKGQLVDLFDKATISEGEGDMAGSKYASAKSVQVEGDELNIWVDKETHLSRKLSFVSMSGSDKVSGTIIFKKIADGPNHPYTMTLQLPDQSIEINVENFDYLKQN